MNTLVTVAEARSTKFSDEKMMLMRMRDANNSCRSTEIREKNKNKESKYAASPQKEAKRLQSKMPKKIVKEMKREMDRQIFSSCYCNEAGSK